MIRLEKVSKIYSKNNSEIRALDQMDLEIQAGQFAIIRGPSGSGKTTLLMTIAGMQRPDEGTVTIEGQKLYELPLPRRARFRAENIGFVFQMFHLIPYLSALENVLLAGSAACYKNDKEKAREILDNLGMAERLNHLPAELSAGEKQRTAIARALFNNPKFILADEPTGNLDEENTRVVLDYLSGYHRKGGTVILVTHGSQVDEYGDRVIRLALGKTE